MIASVYHFKPKTRSNFELKELWATSLWALVHTLSRTFFSASSNPHYEFKCHKVHVYYPGTRNIFFIRETNLFDLFLRDALDESQDF